MNTGSELCDISKENFEVYGSEFKPHPFGNLDQATVLGITHGVFFFCVCKDPLNRFLSFCVKVTISCRQGRVKEMEQPKPLHRGRQPHRNSKGTAFRLSLYIRVFSCVMNTRHVLSLRNHYFRKRLRRNRFADHTLQLSR